MLIQFNNVYQCKLIQSFLDQLYDYEYNIISVIYSLLFFNQNVTQLTVRKTNYQLCKELRQMRTPNDQQSFGLRQDNLDQMMFQQHNPIVTQKHQRAKSSFQKNYKQGTPNTDLEELEGDKLFDQFFKLNNSRSDSDFMRESIQRETKSIESDFLKFVENAIEYHKQSELHFRPLIKKNPQLDQKIKELNLSNRFLANELNRYKQKEHVLKNKVKLMQKEFQSEITQLIQKNEWLEELLVKQKIDNENSLLALKKSLEMIQGKCKCQKDVKSQVKQQFDLQATHSSSELSSNTEEEDFQYDFFKRRKSLSKVIYYILMFQNSDDHQFFQSKIKNPKDYSRDFFLRKKSAQDPYYT
ncbi:unnamed protein product [Paramecium primaurelia]|uniref:Uncharacterized protein n=1 Tax=Paramecium primaurelia TaxID=5886 RepID=A0A8S1JTX6_PARPR|nr:unnamed protein product [Paramecium primaurelia]